MGQSIYSGGAKAYILLRKRGVPLHGPTTLKRHAGKLDLQPGFLSPVMRFTMSILSRLESTALYPSTKSKCMKRTSTATAGSVSQRMMVMIKGLVVNNQQVYLLQFRQEPHNRVDVWHLVQNKRHRSCSFLTCAQKMWAFGEHYK